MVLWYTILFFIINALVHCFRAVNLYYGQENLKLRREMHIVVGNSAWLVHSSASDSTGSSLSCVCRTCKQQRPVLLTSPYYQNWKRLSPPADIWLSWNHTTLWIKIFGLNCCFSVHFDKYKFFPFQQMHTLLKRKMLQFLYYTAPTCFGPHGPSSGSTYQNLTKITLSFKISVKTLR
jgi:hypothetical protein